MISAELQRAFAAYLDDSGSEDDEQVLAGPGVRAGQGLAVYRRNLGGVLVRALESTYPACLRVLGERCFRPLARDYVTNHPSQRPDLNVYGEGFADFIDGFTVAGGPLQEMPYLGDLARLEWLWQQAAYAPSPAPFPFQAFADAVVRTHAQVRLHTASGVGWLCSPYPVTAIRALNLDHADASEVQGLEKLACWCVHGTAAGPSAQEVEPRTQDLLQACAEGVPLARLPEAVGEAESALVQRLSAVIKRGWITTFSAASDPDPC